MNVFAEIKTNGEKEIYKDILGKKTRKKGRF